jgi:hypothetical protein
MSLITQCFSFLAIKPKVWIENDKLCARTSLAARVASLGAYDRCVIVDKRERMISVKTKAWWNWQPEEQIGFERVDEIDRSFRRWSRFSYVDRGTIGRPWRTDQVEFFTISLFLRDPQENVDLFLFWGEGAVETGVTGVLLLNDSLVDLCGDQRTTSLNYATLLAAFTGARVHQFPPQGLLNTLDRCHL